MMECDHIVHGTVELAAADHVSGRHGIGIDHAGPLFAWHRRADDAAIDGAHQSIQHRRGDGHVDSARIVTCEEQKM